MYIYVAKKITNPIYIHFLCGNKYEEIPLCISNEVMINKRIVLANYIKNKTNHYPIILEELFTLHMYRVNCMGNLKEIELMMSYLSTSVIIMHETYSTAAEIGVFGNIDELASKMLVVYPAKNSIKYDCVGTFIKKSFFADNIVDNYRYSCETYKEEEDIFFTTYFSKNKLSSSFLKVLDNFLDKVCKKDIDISICKKNDKCVGYYINNSKKTIHITLSYEILFYSLLAAMTTMSIINNARDPDEFTTNFSLIIKNIFSNTIEYKEKVNSEKFSVSINMVDGNEINKPIKFIYFLLLKLKLIGIDKKNIITVSRELSDIMKKNGSILEYVDKKSFFGDENNE